MMKESGACTPFATFATSVAFARDECTTTDIAHNFQTNTIARNIISQ
jgi:hypothetical protein